MSESTSDRGFTKRFAEVCVPVSILLIVFQIGANTSALEYNSSIVRSERIVNGYLESDHIRRIHERIKATDSDDVNATFAAFMMTYDLEFQDAVIWTRHLEHIWKGIEADFNHLGPAESIARQIVELARFPDQQIFWKTSTNEWDCQFERYIASQAPDLLAPEQACQPRPTGPIECSEPERSLVFAPPRSRPATLLCSSD